MEPGWGESDHLFLGGQEILTLPLSYMQIRDSQDLLQLKPLVRPVQAHALPDEYPEREDNDRVHGRSDTDDQEEPSEPRGAGDQLGRRPAPNRLPKPCLLSDGRFDEPDAPAKGREEEHRTDDIHNRLKERHCASTP